MSHESPTAADLMKKKDKKLVMFDNSENSEIRGSDKEEGEGIHTLLDKLDRKEWFFIEVFLVFCVKVSSYSQSCLVNDKLKDMTLFDLSRNILSFINNVKQVIIH